MGRSVRRTSSVTTPIASSSTAAGSTKDVQLRPAQGRPESLSRPCVSLRLPVWRLLIRRRLLAARSNGRTNKAETLSRARLFNRQNCADHFSSRDLSKREAQFRLLGDSAVQHVIDTNPGGLDGAGKETSLAFLRKWLTYGRTGANDPTASTPHPRWSLAPTRSSSSSGIDVRVWHFSEVIRLTDDVRSRGKSGSLC